MRETAARGQVESERSSQHLGLRPREAVAPSEMRVLAAKDAVQFIRQCGGRLYVWADLLQCPGCSLPFLTAATERPPEEREFTRLSGDDFDLFYSDGDVERPAQLMVELSGWRKKRLSVRTPDFWIKE